jgi:protein-L-isoaspartate(D-aspartate) O-methyltransferase
MVREQLEARGIRDEAVLKAMRAVQRHLFVNHVPAALAYGSHPIPIGCNQTISQPYVVAQMSELLEAQKGMRVLEIGTGSGYQAAVLDAMELDVHTVERLPELYLRASKLFIRLRLLSIHIKLADGTMGWPEAGPFDRIIVTAGGPEVPKPLIEQLANPGIMVIPVGGERAAQQLVQVRKQDGNVTMVAKDSAKFVDLIGEHGWL